MVVSAGVVGVRAATSVDMSMVVLMMVVMVMVV